MTVLRSVVSASPFAQSAAVQPVFAKLDEFIARHMRETGAPGLTLALANRDGVIRVSTYGFADTKANMRVVPETMFEIGSISKSFVGLTLMQLRDEGKLDLNKPIAEYLPWLKIKSKFDAVTTHHILSHTAGLPGAPLLLDALFELQVRADHDKPYQIISGYRNPATNAELKKTSHAVAEHSMHIQGRAIDIRVAGVPTKKLRDLAVAMNRGGVGYYPDANSLHLDTGRIRAW